MSAVPENSVVARRYAARRQAELAAAVTAQDEAQASAEAKRIKPAVPMWVWALLFIASLYGLILLANRFPVIYVIFALVTATVMYFKGYGLRDLFSTPKRKG